MWYCYLKQNTAIVTADKMIISVIKSNQLFVENHLVTTPSSTDCWHCWHCWQPLRRSTPPPPPPTPEAIIFPLIHT